MLEYSDGLADYFRYPANKKSMADNLSLLPDLLGKLYSLSTRNEALWVKSGEQSFRAIFHAGTVEISGTPTPSGLRSAIEQSWFGKATSFLWSWTSLPLQPVFLLASSTDQSVYKWPDRNLTIITPGGQANTFFVDYENPLYSQVSQLLLIAELAAQTDDLRDTLRKLLDDVDKSIAIIDAVESAPRIESNPGRPPNI